MINPKEFLENEGYLIIPNVFSQQEVACIQSLLNSKIDPCAEGTAIHATRKILHEIPSLAALIKPGLQKYFDPILPGSKYFPVKSIYFDKPAHSNWFVSYHQDLTISVSKQVATPKYSKWTKKNGYFSVQPPIELLQQVYTCRIHLDNTNGDNGALRVVPGSHKQGLIPPDQFDQYRAKEVICNVPAGGIMIMQPLILHSSGRSKGGLSRRVLHIEFAAMDLPGELEWEEKIIL